MPPSTANAMPSGDATLPDAPDLVIVGAGIVGLWCARRASAAGLSTVLIDKGLVGQGSSGGFLGALMPHQPVSWSPEKAFQLDALLSLETEIARLEDETGINSGYLRCGRLIPTRTAKKQEQRRTWQTAAMDNWPATSPGGQTLEWRLLDTLPDNSWLSPGAAPLGCELDTLSARLDPRKLVAGLKQSFKHPVHVLENTRLDQIQEGGSSLILSDGTRLTPGHVILAAGHHSFRLLHQVTGRRLGRGVKGQAALLQPATEIDPNAPIIYFGGVYVIAHDSGLIAVGSTSETQFVSPSATDDKLDDLISRATELCPALVGARTIERWAGVRPNAIGRQPMIGPLPEAPRVIACTGGYKISFAIAHRMADAALSFATGHAPGLPESFTIEAHDACAE